MRYPKTLWKATSGSGWIDAMHALTLLSMRVSQSSVSIWSWGAEWFTGGGSYTTTGGGPDWDDDGPAVQQQWQQRICRPKLTCGYCWVYMIHVHRYFRNVIRISGIIWFVVTDQIDLVLMIGSGRERRGRSWCCCGDLWPDEICVSGLTVFKDDRELIRRTVADSSSRLRRQAVCFNWPDHAHWFTGTEAVDSWRTFWRRTD